MRLLFFVILVNLSFPTWAQLQWLPGDADATGRVDYRDLLPMAYNLGQTGPMRIIDQDSDALPLAWSGHFPNGLNYNHSDANGDGVVDLLDIAILQQNQGLAGDEQTFTFSQQMPFSSHQSLVRLGDGAALDPEQVGTTLQVPIYIDALSPDMETNGIAFELGFDPDLVTAFQFTLSSEWMNADLQALLVQHEDESRLNLAVSRLGVDPIIGGGLVGTLDLVVIEDLVGIIPPGPDTAFALVAVENQFLVDGEYFVHQTLAQHLWVNRPTTATSVSDRPIDNLGLRLAPNPAGSQLQLSADTVFEQVELFDAAGRYLRTIYRGPQRSQLTISLADLTPACYLLRVAGRYGQQTVLVMKKSY